MRHVWWHETRETSWTARAGMALSVALGHAALFGLLVLWEPSPRPTPFSDGESVQVRVNPPRSGPPAAQERRPSRPQPAAPRSPASATAPRLPKPPSTPSSLEPTLPPEVVQSEPAESPVLPRAETPSLSSLLPQGNRKYLEEQRDLGAADVGQREAREEFVPRPEMPAGKAERPRVVTTEFSTLAFRLELERRFSDAWGGVRTLPSGSLFHGIPGELIAYNVIINRDGTLRRIVNVSALEQSGRDYSDVDSLVRGFAQSVFPMNPLPERIRDNPFIVRWTLRFVGNRWGLF